MFRIRLKFSHFGIQVQLFQLIAHSFISRIQVALVLSNSIVAECRVSEVCSQNLRPSSKVYALVEMTAMLDFNCAR
jgi:hypothetical protein